MRDTWILIGNNEIWTHNYVVLKRTLKLEHLAKWLEHLAKWLSARLWTKWLWFRILLLSP